MNCRTPSETTFIVAGIVMVILGNSLLAYYTWEKHCVRRDTIMPALLAIFTWSLAGVGDLDREKSSVFKSTPGQYHDALRNE